MSQNIEIAERNETREPEPLAPCHAPVRRVERGMVTIEYAVGAVMVIALVAAIIAAIAGGWFGTLVQGFAQFIFEQFKIALQVR